MKSEKEKGRPDLSLRYSVFVLSSDSLFHIDPDFTGASRCALIHRICETGYCGRWSAAVEAYLEEASALGLKALRIIHGKGIGVQREIVRGVLAQSPLVAGFRNAAEDAGGWGATLVDLK